MTTPHNQLATIRTHCSGGNFILDVSNPRSLGKFSGKPFHRSCGIHLKRTDSFAANAARTCRKKNVRVCVVGKDGGKLRNNV